MNRLSKHAADATIATLTILAGAYAVAEIAFRWLDHQAMGPRR